MEQLRAEIREAFEREQTAQGPMPALRFEPAAAAAADPRTRRSYQWLAAAAAVLLTIAIVAGLLSSRLARNGVPVHPGPTPVATATPVVTPRFQIDYSQPPAGVALIYVADSNHPGWYNAFDWSGKSRGTIELASPLGDQLYLVQAPDGSAFLSSAVKAGVRQLYDRLGAPVTDTSSGLYEWQTWADDSRRLCVLTSSRQQWRIGVRTPGAAPAALHPVALDSSNLSSGVFAIDFGSCSPSQDRAVLVYNYFGRPSEYWVVRLSDGAILSHYSLPANSLSDVVASPDGTLVALNSATSSGYLGGGAAAATTIVRTSNGSRVGDLDPSYGVLAFSHDGSTALVHTSPFAAGVPTQLALIDVQTGHQLWRSNGQDELTSVLVEPSGAGFAILLQDPQDSAVHPSVHLLIVLGDGTPIAVPGSYSQP